LKNFSFVGQTILRNLTTSPFSQKKSTTTTITSPPTITHTTTTTAAAVTTTKLTNSYDHWDSPSPKSPPLQNIGNSPAFGRKRFQPLELILKDQHQQQQQPQAQQHQNHYHQHPHQNQYQQQQQQQGKPSLIPVNHKYDNTSNSKHQNQGNHSPIGSVVVCRPFDPF